MLQHNFIFPLVSVKRVLPPHDFLPVVLQRADEPLCCSVCGDTLEFCLESSAFCAELMLLIRFNLLHSTTGFGSPPKSAVSFDSLLCLLFTSEAVTLLRLTSVKARHTPASVVFWQPSRGQQTLDESLWLCGSGVQRCWSWSSWAAPPKVRNPLFVSGHRSPVPSSRERVLCLCSWEWNPYSLISAAVSTQGHTTSSLKCSRSLALKTCLWFLQGSRSVLQWFLGCKYTQCVVVERSALANNSSCNDEHCFILVD